MPEPVPNPVAPERGMRWGTAAALGVAALGLLLRVRGLGTYWLNPDEGIYYSTLTQPSAASFWAEVAANAHPPGFYLLLRAAGVLTWDFVWLRGLSALAGAAAIWVGWLVGRELGGRGTAGTVAGLVTAALLALNGEAVVLSQVLRPYMPLLVLVGLALLYLLRYRRDPTARNLGAYVGLACTALLVHYSAALALSVFVLLTGLWWAERALDRAAWRRLALAQGVPCALLATLYAVHLGSALRSDLVGEAMGPGGWISEWMVASPAGAWRSYVAFQHLHVPPALAGASALLLLAALAAAAARARTVAVLGGGALLAGITASALGLYPFGPSRHAVWLTFFTLPALGWLAGEAVAGGRRRAVGGGLMVVGALVVGRWVGPEAGEASRTNATEEQVLRRAALTPLVVERLDPSGAPHLVLMSEQAYNLLMPLYAAERRGRAQPEPPALRTLGYGRREIVVANRWEWEDLDGVRETLSRAAPDDGWAGDARVLLVSGGWGSPLFGALPELERLGAVAGASWASSERPAEPPLPRLMALVLDVGRLDAGAAGLPQRTP